MALRRWCDRPLFSLGNSMNSRGTPVLAYLISQYPAVSHTFILREVQQLREFGFVVLTASVKPPMPSAAGFTKAESDEAGRDVLREGAQPAAHSPRSCNVSRAGTPVLTWPGSCWRWRMRGST